MKQYLMIAPLVVGLSACTALEEHNMETEFKSDYAKWKTEMQEVNNGHGEALWILEGFKKKIMHHKYEIAQFANYIADAENVATQLEQQGDSEGLAVLEAQIIENSMANLGKHRKFKAFLENLGMLQSQLEKEITVVEVNAIAMPSEFENYQQALSYWINEMAKINKEHNEALAIISDLTDHIEQHENAISMFGYQITQRDKLAMQGKNEVKDLQVLDKAISKNYQISKQKHAHFNGFLANLKKVEKSFK